MSKKENEDFQAAVINETGQFYNRDNSHTAKYMPLNQSEFSLIVESETNQSFTEKQNHLSKILH